ncbi:MAG: CD225/dispanin family protein [Tannerella sp.]|jgi:hypothetical protein|nr:CD225/dispanin family protein [Tannerella sp.]
MLCPKCKNPIDEGAVVCEWCGHIKKTPPPPPPPVNTNAGTVNNPVMTGNINYPYVIPSRPKNYMGRAVVATIISIFSGFILMPIGIVAIVYANKVETAYKSGDYSKARHNSLNAKKLSNLTIVLSIIFYGLVLLSKLAKIT